MTQPGRIVLYVFLFVCLAGVNRAAAQADAVVNGRILGADGAALPAASVTLIASRHNQPLSATPDDGGWFGFPRVPPGEYVLVAAAPGFAESRRRLVLQPRETRSIVLTLPVAPVREAVTVEGTGPAGTHSPSSTRLSSDGIGALPEAQRANLPEAIVHLAPGMIRGHDDFVHIRGHEIALNPVINGVSFWENPHALLSAGLSPDVIDSASVMTGGFPAEYGNRFGGVVDLVTKSGLTVNDAGSVRVSAGGEGRRSVAGEHGGRRGRVGYFAAGTILQSDRFLSPPAPQAIHDEGRSAHGFFQVDVALASGYLRGTVVGDGAGFDIARTPHDLELRPVARPSQRARQQTAIVQWSRARSDVVGTLSGYQRWSRSELLPAEGPLTARASLDRTLRTVGVKADAVGSMGRHAFKAGLDVARLAPRETLAYDYNGYRELTHLLGLGHIHVHGNAIAFSGSEAGSHAGTYVQDTMAIGPRVTVNAGARLDRHDLVTSATHLSPRANVAIRVAGDAVLHASYNHFFVAPPVEGVLSSAAGLTASIREIGSALPAVAPTIEDQVELGVRVPSRVAQVSVTGYYRDTDNPVHTTVWPDSRIYSYASFDRAVAYGLEVSVDASRLARYGVTAGLNYALGVVDFFNPVTGGFVTEAAHLTASNRFPGPMDQRHTLTAGATYTHARSGTWLGASVDYGSGTPIGHGGGGHEHDDGIAHEHGAGVLGDRVPAHTTGNLSAGMDLLRRAGRRPRLTLRVDIENVSNRPYLIATEGPFTPTQYSVPRIVSAGLTIRF